MKTKKGHSRKKGGILESFPWEEEGGQPENGGENNTWGERKKNDLTLMKNLDDFCANYHFSLLFFPCFFLLLMRNAKCVGGPGECK